MEFHTAFLCFALYNLSDRQEAVAQKFSSNTRNSDKIEEYFLVTKGMLTHD